MYTKDPYHELIIAVISGIIIFLVVTGMVVFILLFYQKKKFQHRRQITDMQHRFTEEIFKSRLEMQEQTFNEISSEIHDNVGQILSLTKVQINILLQKQGGDLEMLMNIKDNIGKSIVDLRNIAKSLNNEFINGQAIYVAVATEAERINRTTELIIAVEIEGEEKKPSNEKKLILFRIIQECLQNILKHAAAKNVQILFNYQAEYMQVRIIDDGIGFDVNAAMMKKSGLGLSNIEKRAHLAGGSFRIGSTLGRGTSSEIVIPYV